MNQTSRDIVLGVILGVLFAGILLFTSETPKRKQYITLPEEIQAAQSGDTLTIYKQGDTTHLGFYHGSLRDGETLILVK